MAKYGEGDEQWIVEDRPVNVHNWQWSETDCFEWSKTILSNLFTNQTILNGEGGLFIKTKDIDIQGEAYVNVRKGKIIPGYELSLVINWTGEAKGESGDKLADVSGAVEVPYISDENADVDPDLRVVVKDEGVFRKRFNDAFLSKGKAFVLEKIRVYVDAMTKGGPVNDELEVKKVSSKAAAGAGTKAVEAAAVPDKKVEGKRKEWFNMSKIDKVVIPANDELEVKKVSTKAAARAGPMVFELAAVPYKKVEAKREKRKELFNIPKIEPIVKVVTDIDVLKGSMQSNTKISKEVDGEVCIVDGSVTGTNLKFQEGKWIIYMLVSIWSNFGNALVFLFVVVFAILGVFAHLHFGFGGANTTLNFCLFIYWLMYVDPRRQFVRSMCVLAAAFCFGAIASRYYGN